MSRWLKPITLGMALVLLSGCDQVKQTITDIAIDVAKVYSFGIPIVFRPNSYVVLDGKATRIQGFDDCLKDQPRGQFTVQTSGSDELDKGGCLVIRPDTTSVSVKYFPQGQPPAQETWTVERGDSGIRLRRPDGKYILDPMVLEKASG
jgi:hypothetical protein